jgi:thymidylate synthase
MTEQQLAGRRTITEPTIGQAWLAIAADILERGRTGTYDGLPICELAMITLEVERPDPDDELIAAHADPQRLAWMRANFVDHARVAALGDADSYATRLYDYEHSGRDQIAWVIDRLRSDPRSRSASITTFQPHTDTSYIPCVSLLDFWRPDEALDLVVYAHSIDFGAKGYANLVQLAELQRHVAQELAVPVGRLTVIIKSAHVYDTELDYMRGVLRATRS